MNTVKEYDFQKYTTNFETIQKGIYFNYDWGEGTLGLGRHSKT